MAYELLEQALIADIELDYFWDSSYANIVLKLQAFAERKDIERKRDAVNNYTLAQLIGMNVGAMFSKNGKVPSIEKCFPHLFDDELATQSKEEVVPEGSLCAAEVNFLAGMIELQNRRNRQKKQNNDKE